MTRSKQLQQWRAGLRASFPLIGSFRRKQAVGILVAQRAHADVIPLLIEALASPHHFVAAQASEALSDLTTPDSIGALCSVWSRSRDARLGELIARNKYVASGPLGLRVLSGLKCGAMELLTSADGGLVTEIMKAWTDNDPVIAGNAEQVLNNLTNPGGIDALCSVWSRSRDTRLGELIARNKYVASGPLDVRILSALRCDKRLTIDRADVVSFVVGLLTNGDEALRNAAERSLASTTGVAQDALCEVAIREPKGEVAKLCVRAGKRPREHERLCLFLFVTALTERRQLDQYFVEDFEFQNLRLAYDRADEKVRGHVMEVIRSGDRRCAGFLGTRSKPLAECNDQEIRLALESWRKHAEWSRMFQACLELPLRYSLGCFALLRDAEWEPESADLRSVFRAVMAEVNTATVPLQEGTVTSSLFEEWLAEGRGDLAQLDESVLCGQLASAAPPRGVAIVAALAGKQRHSGSALQSVRTNPHWLVRMAGHATADLLHDEIQDANYWITELCQAKGVLDYWPGKDPAAGLKQLAAAPREAFAGRFGTARRILQTILQHRNTDIRVGDFVVRADEFDVIVKDA